MLRFLLAIALVICLSLTLCMTLMRAAPYDDEQLRVAFGLLDDCSRPCWEQIHLGESTADDVLSILNQRPWAAAVEADAFWIQWQWEIYSPPFIDPSVRGKIFAPNGQVEAIILASTAQMGDFYLSYGPPRWLSTWRSNNEVVIIFLYPDESLSLTIAVPCPVTRKNFWQAHPYVRLEVTNNSTLMFTMPLMDHTLSC